MPVQIQPYDDSKRKQKLGNLATIGGALAGGFLAKNPLAGAAAGAALGSTAGQLMANKGGSAVALGAAGLGTMAAMQGSEPEAKAEYTDTAMSRRMSSIDGQEMDNVKGDESAMALKEAQAALKTQPKPIQDAYKAPIDNALARDAERRKKQYASNNFNSWESKPGASGSY